MTVRILGVDPGLQNMGLAVLETVPGELPKLLDLAVIVTKKTKDKRRRVTDDDVDRMNLLWLNIHQLVVDFDPEAVGVETYTVFRPGQGGHGKGAGWKAVFAYAMTCAVAFEHKIPVYAFRPTDMKRKIAKNASADKRDVEDAVRPLVQNLDEFLATIPDGAHEHATDALGHALCALEKHAD